MTPKQRTLFTILALGFVSVVVVSFRLGVQYGGQNVGVLHLQADARETRIMELIVERNPKAAIKDFQGFPRMLIQASDRAGLDYRLVLAVADKESEFKADAVSHAGAIGFLQLMPGTGKLMADRLKIEYVPPKWNAKVGKYDDLGSLGDPKINVVLGIEYLRIQVEKYGTTATALRGYNRSPESATKHWSGDYYAEGVALKFLAYVHALPR